MKKILLFLLTISTLNAQSIADTLHNKHLAYVETGIMAATGKDMPFWLRSNQYGIVMPNSKAQATLRGGYYYDHDLDKKGHLDWGFGINAVANIGAVTEPSRSGSPLAERSRSGKGEILLPEAYARIRYKWFDLFAGRKREIYGLVDTTLSSGSYIWSGNALPMPKIQIGWTDYKPIIGKGFISLKGSFAHGWFGEQTAVKNYYLHQKTLYGRIGRVNAKVHFYGGFNHQVQWGGEVKYKDSERVAVNGKFPSKGIDYLLTVTGLSLIRLSQWGLIDQSKYSYNDAFNRIGNHLGTIDLGMKLNLKQVSLDFYRQNIYEDGSLFYLANIEDGLNGLTINIKKPNSILQKINIEYLNTSDQGVSSNTKNPTSNDNYMNHGAYRDGWSYGSFGIGTPFIEPNPTAYRQILNSDSLLFSQNNRIKALNVSVRGSIKSFNFDLKTSFAQVFVNPITKKGGIYGYHYLYISKPILIQKRNCLMQLKLASDNFKSLGSSLIFHIPL